MVGVSKRRQVNDLRKWLTSSYRMGENPENSVNLPAKAAGGALARVRTANFWGESAVREGLEAPAGIEPAYTDLQSAASPLRHRAMPEAGLLATFRPACNLPNSGLCAFIADCMCEAAC